jgi:glycosyltransferase involved in cell wall biosynthesis
MSRKDHLSKIAFVSSYLPRQCGIATFTNDVLTAVGSQAPEVDCIVVPVTDREESYDYPPEARFEILEHDLPSYRRAADFLNFSNCDAVSIQHEYGIFGGKFGSHILTFARNLEVPLVTTFHTVLREPKPEQVEIARELAAVSDRVVVMTQHARQFLEEIYGVPAEKIDIIAHGIPDMPFVDPNFFKDQFGVEGKHVLLTFGLLGPNKGIEYVLRALPEVVERFPDLVYIILGATHTYWIKREGEAYRLGLERLAQDLGIKQNVVFYNRFVEASELREFLGAADIYITPYLFQDQVTSGTLAYAFGCGKVVVSTPYWHAQELLADGRGILVPFEDPPAIARELIGILGDDSRRHSMRKKAYLLGREMVWSQAGHLYVEAFQKARSSRPARSARSQAMRTLSERQAELPQVRLDQLKRLTDATGILQHARFSFPYYERGYRTDDNARALLLTVLLEDAGHDSVKLRDLASRYAAFLNYAFNPEQKRFRRHLSYNREWQDQGESEVCQAECLWALGVCVGRSHRPDLQVWAAQLYEQALPTVTGSASPLACAYGILGIHEYFRRFSGDRSGSQGREELTERLLAIFREGATDECPLPSEAAEQEGATLAHAMLLSGRWTGNEEAYSHGLRALRWLAERQSSQAGHFRPVRDVRGGTGGVLEISEEEYPLEAQAMIAAALEVFQTTRDTFWLRQATRAFDWFLGRNDLGREVYDASTGGCHDGLHVDRVNQNQGAEATLSYLLSLVQMQLVENALHPFGKQQGAEPQKAKVAKAV